MDTPTPGKPPSPGPYVEVKQPLASLPPPTSPLTCCSGTLECPVTSVTPVIPETVTLWPEMFAMVTLLRWMYLRKTSAFRLARVQACNHGNETQVTPSSGIKNLKIRQNCCHFCVFTEAIELPETQRLMCLDLISNWRSWRLLLSSVPSGRPPSAPCAC